MQNKTCTVFIAQVDGDGVAITWDLRVTAEAARKIRDFCETLSHEEVEQG